MPDKGEKSERERWGVVAVRNFKYSYEYQRLKLQADFSDPKSDELHDVDELLRDIEEYNVADDKYFSDEWVQETWEEVWNLMGLNGDTAEIRMGVIDAANLRHVQKSEASSGTPAVGHEGD